MSKEKKKGGKERGIAPISAFSSKVLPRPEKKRRRVRRELGNKKDRKEESVRKKFRRRRLARLIQGNSEASI